MTGLDSLYDVEDASVGLAESLVGWLESGLRPDDLFADGVVADLSVPLWRVQVSGADAVFHMREDDHPFPGTVTVEALDRTSRGFLLQFEERWDAAGQRWYCRELIHCAVVNGRINELAIYCTGDWDEATQARYADEVRRPRPRT